MTIISKATYRFSGSLSKYQWHFFFYRTRKNNLKIFMETQKTPNSQNNLEKEKRSGGIRLSVLRLHYIATVIKTV